MNDRVYIFDTTLRDGEQTPGVNLNNHEKLEIALQLERLKVDVIEAGFPAASPGDLASVAEIAAKIRGCSIAGLARAVRADIDKCHEALKAALAPRIHIFLATSPLHMEYKLKMSPEEVLGRAIESVAYARTLCDSVEFSCEDGSRSERDFLYRVLEGVIEAGATVVNIPDTVGYSMPGEYEALISGVMNSVKGIEKAIVSVHCHDDLGLGVANSLAGIKGGARQVEGSMNGMGERAGNAALEEVIMSLRTRHDLFGLTTGIDTRQIYRTSRIVRSLTGVEVPPNKAVIGKNAFRHESGIHQHGVMANRETYEIMTPESIGIKQNEMVLGKHSGRHAFVDKLRGMGYTVDDAQIDALFERFKVLADRKKDIDERDLDALIAGAVANAEPVYELESFQLQSGNQIRSIASVCLKQGDEITCEAAVGDGPVDAAFNAVDKIVKEQCTLEAYRIKGVTEGKDALGEVIVQVRIGDTVHVGKGLSTDVIEASVRAYIAAINHAAALG